MREVDAVIIGAGPAGLVTAIELLQKGWRVSLIDKAKFPRQKVCGGFVGPENKAILQEYGVLEQLESAGVAKLQHIQLSTQNGKDLMMPIQFGKADTEGMGVSRMHLDAVLLNKARDLGAEIHDQAILEAFQFGRPSRVSIRRRVDRQEIHLKTHVLINASGFCMKKTDQNVFFGGAALFQDTELNADTVALHFIDKGHIGVNHFEGGLTNVCFVVDQKRIKKGKPDFEKLFQIFLEENPVVAKQLAQAKQVSPWKGTFVSLRNKKIWFDKGVFHVGDALGVVHPVVGGGISMAISNGRLLGQLLISSHPQNANSIDMQKKYKMLWKKKFRNKLFISEFLGRMSHRVRVANGLAKVFQLNQNMFNQIYKIFHHQESRNHSLKKGKVYEPIPSVKNY